MRNRLPFRLQYNERSLEGGCHHRPRRAVGDGLGGITRDTGEDIFPYIWPQDLFHLSSVPMNILRKYPKDS